MSKLEEPGGGSQIKILLCCHKPCLLPPQDSVLLPIQVGRSLSSYNLSMQADNEVGGRGCDNISHKNESYCELTAMYWAWKNLRAVCPDVRYVGLFHYRRFFAFEEKNFLSDVIIKPEREILNYRIDSALLLDILNRGNVIVAKRMNLPRSVKQQYCAIHISEDYRVLHDVIRERFNDYYGAFLEVMNGNKLSAYNMFVMPYDDFAGYCEWLFSVLSAVEMKIPYRYYSAYQKRVFGFIAERLLNVYLKKKGQKLKFCNVYSYEEETQRSLLGSSHVLGWCRNFTAYFMKELCAKLQCIRAHE